MKQCSRCKELKSFDEFYKRGKSRSGYQTYCKSCNSASVRERYRRVPDEYKESARRYRAKLNEIILAYKLEHPCVDCGEADPIVLDFDHVRGIKTMNVSKVRVNAQSIEKLMEEIAKCEVRCANCHRRITHARRSSSSSAK